MIVDLVREKPHLTPGLKKEGRGRWRSRRSEHRAKGLRGIYDSLQNSEQGGQFGVMKQVDTSQKRGKRSYRDLSLKVDTLISQNQLTGFQHDHETFGHE